MTEVDVCFLVSLCSGISLSLGYFLQPSSGKTGTQIAEKYTEIIKTVSKCEACVRSKPAHLNTIPPETPCKSLCQDCWTNKDLCAQCRGLGRKTIYPQLEPCFQCLEKGINCKKVVFYFLAMDCFTGNRFMIEQFQKDLLDGTKDPEVFLTEPIGEIIHILKTIKSSFSNWFVLGLGGNIINLSMLRTLRDDNKDKVITAALRRVLQKGSVVNRDRQDTDCLIEFSKLVPVLREVIQDDPIVVHQIWPEKYKMEPTNKPGALGAIRFLGAVNIGHIAAISDDKQNENISILSLLELHSPVRIKIRLELPYVIGFVSSESMVVFTTETDLMFVEVVKGSVIPKIPNKKADFIALCKELGLYAEGTVKVLKSRLVKKLNPSTKLLPSAVRKDPVLACHLNKSCILSKGVFKEGLVKSLIIADNASKKLLKVGLDFGGGEVSSKTMIHEYPGSVTDVRVSVTCQDVILLISTSFLTVVDNSFNTLSTIILDSSITDICDIDNSFFFIRENQIQTENLENFVRGIFNPVLVAGSGAEMDKDGSGKSSSFLETLSISSYQKSIIIGTESGKVKIISDVNDIADFLSNTFDVGVEGFGLHKKAGKGNVDADLDSCQVAHNKMGIYLEKVTTKIKDSFKYQLPAKFNGPQHSVSAVTISTIKMAETSFLQIKKNLKLASTEDNDLTFRVNPSSTTTKVLSTSIPWLTERKLFKVSRNTSSLGQ